MRIGTKRKTFVSEHRLDNSNEKERFIRKPKCTFEIRPSEEKKLQSKGKSLVLT